jgi:hypothetical protein
MKKKPLSETEFAQLTPDALDPSTYEVEHETDWLAWALGSGLASVVALILVFVDMHFAEKFFKGRSIELAQNMSYCLIATTLGLGLYSAYAFVKSQAHKFKANHKPDHHTPKR